MTIIYNIQLLKKLVTIVNVSIDNFSELVDNHTY